MPSSGSGKVAWWEQAGWGCRSGASARYGGYGAHPAAYGAGYGAVGAFPGAYGAGYGAVGAGYGAVSAFPGALGGFAGHGVGSRAQEQTERASSRQGARVGTVCRRA